MRKTMIAIIVGVGSFLTVCDTEGQEMDPEEAIAGAWMVDIGTALELIDRETDPEINQGLQMMLGMSMSYMVEFRDDGSMLKGGVKYPGQFTLESDDEGALRMIPENDQMSAGFNRIEFDGPDRIMMTATMEGQPPLGIPYVRVFPIGMLADSNVNPDSESAIQGWWVVDAEQIEAMPWIIAIDDERFRNGLIQKAGAMSKIAAFGFFDGTVYAYSDQYDETEAIGPYTIRASDGNLIALSFPIGHGQDSETPLLRIKRKKDENRIELVMLQLAPGPLPMVRRDDVEAPSH